MKLAGIIINYRTPEMTGDAVSALLVELALVGPSHLFLVDNDSRDGSLEYFERRAREENWGDRVSLIANTLNGGYGYGINVGVRAGLALPNPPDYYYILNSDASADAGSLRTLVDFMDGHPSVGIAGSRIRYPSGQTQGGAFRFMSFVSELERQAELAVLSKLFRRWIVAPDPPNVSSPVDWVPGTSMLIRRSTFESVGFFDEGFFLYFEEVDYCLRAKQAGVAVYYVDGAPITHLGSVSTGMEDESKRFPLYWFESRHRYFLKHHGLAYAAACDAAWVTGSLLRRLKHKLKPGKPERPRVFRDFVKASMLHLTNAKGLLSAGGPPRPDERQADELGLLELLLEDLETYEWELLRPGLWAVTAHRLAGIADLPGPPLRRGALKIAHAVLATGVDLGWGIRIPESVKLGRRVRLRNSGYRLLNARSIGNDVSIWEDTTLGPLDGTPEELPVVGDRVTIGSGASVLGDVTVGSDRVVQSNSVVLEHAVNGVARMGVPVPAAK